MVSDLSWEDLKKQEWSNIEKMALANSQTIEWTNIVDIVNILNTMKQYNQICHTLFPDGGGMDFCSAELSGKDNILLNCGSLLLLKPKILYFEKFSDAPEWNYFFLEADAQQPIGENLSNQRRELVIRQINGDLTSYNDNLEEEYHRDGLRRIDRYISRGNFLFVLKPSPYNRIGATYDGRHDRFTAHDFKEYMHRLKNTIEKEN